MITGLNHITLAVRDIKKSFAFYKDTLGFKPLCLWDKGAYFLVGGVWFCLNVDENRTPHPCYTYYAFTVSADDFERVQTRIMAAGTIIFKENTSPGESLYFLDPDDHKLEIHCGDWQSRLAVKRNQPGSWQDIEWFV